MDVGSATWPPGCGGSGAVGIHNLMEDAATAEISRSQIWQWIHNDIELADTGKVVTRDLVERIIGEELADIKAEPGYDEARYGRPPPCSRRSRSTTTSPSSSPSPRTTACPDAGSAAGLAMCADSALEQDGLRRWSHCGNARRLTGCAGRSARPR